MKPFHSIGTKVLIAFSILTVLLIGSGGANLWAVQRLSSTSNMVGKELAPLADAAMETQLQLAHAGEALESYGSSGMPTDKVQVIKSLDLAEFYARVILEGGENETGTYIAATDPDIRASAEANLEALAAFKTATMARAESTNPGKSSRAYTKAFKAFRKAAQATEAVIHERMDAGLAELGAVQKAAVTITLAVTGIIIAMVVLLYVFTNRTVIARIHSLAETLGALGKDEKNVALPKWKSNDELGLLRAAVADFKVAIEERARLAAEGQATLANLAAKEAEARRNAEDLAKREREADANAQALAMRQEQSIAMNAELSEVVQRVSAGELNARLKTDWDDHELDELSRVVNQLISTIDTVFSEANHVIAAIAEADLTQEFNQEFRGDFGKFQKAVAATITRLSEMITRISSSGKEVLGGSDDLSVVAQALATQNEEQARALSEIVAALDQVSATVTANAESARSARNDAGQANELADAGSAVIADTMTAVRQIAESSAEIVGFVNAIEDIAFQTNLLALNASVEAARAGEAGKGFAVVAAEVRALAQKTSQEADHIKNIISKSEANVSHGVKLVENTRQQIEHIQGAISALRERIGEVDTASSDQAASIREVVSSVNQIDQAVNEGTHRATQCQQASQSLNDEARTLEAVVATFQLPGERRQDRGDETVMAAE